MSKDSFDPALTSPGELAAYVNEKWESITSLPQDAKHSEDEFPRPVLNLIEIYGVNYNEFCDAWTALHE